MKQEAHFCGKYRFISCYSVLKAQASISFPALGHHFENQMSPTPLAWYAHKLPDWLLKFAAVVVLQCEIVVPLLTFFAPIRRLRLFGFYVQVCNV